MDQPPYGKTEGPGDRQMVARPPFASARLMLQAAELVWQAGPLQKYPGLCHGTPGNGYSLLKMYQHTGDRLWLERARQFALTAIAQRENILLGGGTAQYALWTGDMGPAMFLADCIDARGDFPTLDYF